MNQKTESTDRAELTFGRLSVTNSQRCVAVFHPVCDWSETDWACAAAGEMGELCNLIKKRRRGDDIANVEVADEMADVVIYIDLLASRIGIDLSEAVRRKFNEVSARRRCDIRL